MQRVQEAPNRVVLSAEDCSFDLIRETPRVVRVVVHGVDKGQFGTAVLSELMLYIQQAAGELELFIETDDGVSVTVDVSNEWTRFFAAQRPHLKRVSVLAGSRLMHLTVAIAQHRSETGNLIQIYSDRQLFEDMFQRALLETRPKGPAGIRSFPRSF
jgi:hypothetical protein